MTPPRQYEPCPDCDGAHMRLVYTPRSNAALEAAAAMTDTPHRFSIFYDMRTERVLDRLRKGME